MVGAEKFIRLSVPPVYKVVVEIIWKQQIKPLARKSSKSALIE